MGRKFQIKRGNEANIPILAPGEMGFTLDSKKLFVGTGSKNVPINSSALQEDANGNMSMKGNLTLKGSGNFGSKINFGDGDYVHISEPADDTLEIKGTRVNLVGTVSATTAAAGTNTTQVATTAFVQNALATGNLPAGFGNFNRTIFSYSGELNLPKISSMDYVLAKFIAPVAGTYKYTFELLITEKSTFRMSINSASYLGSKQARSISSGHAYNYIPEMKFKEYTECTIGGLTSDFKIEGNVVGNTTITTIDFEAIQLNIYVSNTIYFPAQKGQSLVLKTYLSHASSGKIKNQKTTY